MKDKHIHVLWQGPYTYKVTRKMKGTADYGVYQIYGCHPVYGSDALAYIGMAREQTFGVRFEHRERISRDIWADNWGHHRIYLGRIHKTVDESHPLDPEWGELIVVAEKLLITGHAPAWNSQGLGDLKPDEWERFGKFHVFNWGQYAQLLPEVSGARVGYGVFNGVDEHPLGFSA